MPGNWIKMYLIISGQLQYLWRALDHEGWGIDILAQNLKDSFMAKRSLQLQAPLTLLPP
ncbi:MAG: hypothetical protein RL768_402 [Nitrospirota bacterium]|jgi:transposase-like protein